MLVLPHSFLLSEQDNRPCPWSNLLFHDRTSKLSGRRKEREVPKGNVPYIYDAS